jgi:hypothetical protein
LPRGPAKGGTLYVEWRERLGRFVERRRELGRGITPANGGMAALALGGTIPLTQDMVANRDIQ